MVLFKDAVFFKTCATVHIVNIIFLCELLVKIYFLLKKERKKSKQKGSCNALKIRLRMVDISSVCEVRVQLDKLEHVVADTMVSGCSWVKS